MSWQASQWAAQKIRIDGTSKCLLMIMAEVAGDDGRGVWLSQSSLAERTGFTDRTVRTAIRNLQERGLISYGDQSIVAHLPASQRPTVWDLKLSVVWVEPAKEKRSNRAPKPPETPSAQPPETDSTPGNSFPNPRKLFPVPPETVSATPGKSFRQTVLEPSVEPSVEPLSHVSTVRADAQSATDDIETRVQALCQRLHDHIVANDVIPDPSAINRQWENEARALLQLDNREFAKVMNLIDWCQQDEFWPGVIEDMAGFRRNYRKIHAKATAQWKARKTATQSTAMPTADRSFVEQQERAQRLIHAAPTEAAQQQIEAHRGGFFPPHVVTLALVAPKETDAA